MFGFGSKFKKEEEAIAQWLAHPNEFGVAPKRVKHRRAHALKTMWGPVTVHVLDYEMPDGTRGIGFVNPITWSFFADRVPEIPEDELVRAYMGWAFLFPALQSGKATSDFVSEGEEQRFLEMKAMQRVFSDIEITARYKIGTSELFEYRGKFEGMTVRGAGNVESEVVFDESDPCYDLPAIYFLLGREVVSE